MIVPRSRQTLERGRVFINRPVHVGSHNVRYTPERTCSVHFGMSAKCQCVFSPITPSNVRNRCYNARWFDERFFEWPLGISGEQDRAPLLTLAFMQLLKVERPPGLRAVSAKEKPKIGRWIRPRLAAVSCGAARPCQERRDHRRTTTALRAVVYCPDPGLNCPK